MQTRAATATPEALATPSSDAWIEVPWASASGRTESSKKHVVRVCIYVFHGPISCKYIYIYMYTFSGCYTLI